MFHILYLKITSYSAIFILCHLSRANSIFFKKKEKSKFHSETHRSFVCVLSTSEGVGASCLCPRTSLLDSCKSSLHPDTSCHSSPGLEPRARSAPCSLSARPPPCRASWTCMLWLFTYVVIHLQEKALWNSAHWAIERPDRENNPKGFSPTLRFKFHCSLIISQVHYP